MSLLPPTTLVGSHVLSGFMFSSMCELALDGMLANVISREVEKR